MTDRPTATKAPQDGIALLKLTEISANLKANPRGEDWVDSDEFQALKNNIVETQKRGFPSGLLQSVTVKPALKGKGYTLVAGYRRYVALSQLAKEKEGKKSLYPWAKQIPCVIQSEGHEDTLSTLDALVENLQRQSMPLLEEAQAFQEVLDVKKCTRSELAKLVGVSPAYITQRMQLLKLDAEVLSMAADMELGISPLRDISRLPNTEEQLALLDEIKHEKVLTDDIRERVTAQIGKAKRGRPSKDPEIVSPDPDQPQPPVSGDDEGTDPDAAASGPVDFSEGIPVVPQADPESVEVAQGNPEDPAEAEQELGDEGEGEKAFSYSGVESERAPTLSVEALTAVSDTETAADLAYLRNIAKSSSKATVRLVAVAVIEWEKRRAGGDSAFTGVYSAESLSDALGDAVDSEF